MIAERLEDQIDWLERAAKRGNDDLREVGLKVLHNMRIEVARLRELENSGVLTLPEQEERSHGETR